MIAILTRNALGIVLTLFLLTTLAEARQVTPSFERLAESLRRGSEITVTDVSGDDSRGEVIGLSATTIELMSGGAPRSFSQTQVHEIRHHTRGPLGNGAFWGMAIGTGIGGGLGVAAAVDDGLFDPGGEAILVGIAIGAVLGTTTGVLIDILRKENRLIYAAPGEQVLFQLGVTGAKVSFRF